MATIEVSGWVIVTSALFIVPESFRKNERDCTHDYLDYRCEWNEMKRLGYRCLPCKLVVEVPEAT